MGNFTSKKFSAAEKHFQKLLDNERRRNKRLAEDYVAASDAVDELTMKVEELKKENLKLIAELEVTSNAAKLTPEDRKALLEKAYKTGELFNLLTALDGRGYFG